MTVRHSLAVVVVGIQFAAGCASPSSPTSASSPTSPSSSGGAAVGPQAIGNGAPLIAKLRLVDTLVVNANQQLKLFSQGDPITTPDPVLPNALKFYVNANSVLDGIPPNPILPGNDTLNAIIQHANITLDLITHIPPNPILPQSIAQANHTIFVATNLQSCNFDVCGG